MKYLILLLLASNSFAQMGGSAMGPVQFIHNNSIANVTDILGLPVNLLGSFPLPAGAATSALQTTGNASLASILANQTNGTQTSSRNWSLLNSTDSISSWLKDGSGNSIGSTAGALNVNISSGSITASNPSVSTTGTVVPASATMVGGSDGTNLRAVKVSSTGVVSVDGSAVTQPVSGTFYQATQPVSIATMPSTPVTGTFWQATQPVSGSLSVSNFPATQPVSGTVAVTQSTSPWVVNGSGYTQPVSGTFWQATQPVSGTFYQATQPVSIATMPTTPVTGTFYQATQPVSIAGTVSTTTARNTTGTLNSAAISGVTSVSAPANATGFTIQADDDNTANFRWVVGGTASATNGIEMQPGRSESMDLGATISICPESGTQTYIIQWKAP